MAETTLREKIVVDGTEAAAAKLNMLASSAGRVAHAFGGLTEAAGMLGGLAGVWQIAESVREVDRLYAAVGRVTNMTEMTAEQAHGMFKQFQMGGIEMEASERIMTSMTRSAEKMSDGFGGVGTQALMVKNLMSQIGASAKAGPEERLLAMSKAAQHSKLNIDELIRAFMIPRSQAGAMMSMLKQGPERLKEIFDDTQKSGSLITAQALASYRQMVQNRRELREAWQDIVGVFYKNLLPGVTEVLKGIKKEFDRIKPVAEAIGKFLAKHMHEVVSATRLYIKLLLVAKAINLFSGPDNQMGVLGRGKQLATGAWGFMGKRAAAAGSMDYFAAREAAARPGVLGGLLSRVGLGGAKAAGSGVGMFETAGGPLIRIIGSVAGKIGIIGAIISVVVVAFQMLKNNTWGIATAFKKVFSGIWASFSAALSKIVAVLGVLWQVIEPVIKIIAGGLLFGLLVLGEVVKFLGDVINKVMSVIIDMINWVISHSPLRLWVDQIDLMKKVADKAEEKAADNKAGNGVNQDFRGSKFEINNNFPTGIDGGRVAVAFGDELAKLGERRLDSGLRPLFSYR